MMFFCFLKTQTIKQWNRKPTWSTPTWLFIFRHCRCSTFQSDLDDGSDDDGDDDGSDGHDFNDDGGHGTPVTIWSPCGHQVVVKTWIFNCFSILKACFVGLRWHCSNNKKKLENDLFFSFPNLPSYLCYIPSCTLLFQAVGQLLLANMVHHLQQGTS